MQRILLTSALALACVSFGCNSNPVGPDPALKTTLQGNSLVTTASPSVPVKGTESINYQIVGFGSEPNTFLLLPNGRGDFSHLGKTSSVTQSILDFVTGIGSGTSKFTAANGDEVHTTWTRQPISADEASYDVTVIGGTGRFVGSSGSLTGTTTVVSRAADGLSGTLWASWRGSISY